MNNGSRKQPNRAYDPDADDNSVQAQIERCDLLVATDAYLQTPIGTEESLEALSRVKAEMV